MRQIQGQSPEETGDVRSQVLRGFPKGDNAEDGVLWTTALTPQGRFEPFGIDHKVQSIVDIRHNNIRGADHLGGGALRADDRVAVTGILDRLDQGLTQISVARADLGGTQTRIEDVADRLAQRGVDLASRLSLTEDADAAEVFSALVNEQAGLEAALAAAQRLIQPTLLDFLG